MIIPNLFNLGVIELGIGIGILLLLLTVVLSISAYRDMRRRSRSVGWAVASFLLVLLLPIVGLMTYLLLRPPETLTEKYDRALKREVMLQQIETSQSCPGCSRAVERNWMICPECHVMLRRPCAYCGTALDLHWQICPVCTNLVEAVERPSSDAPATP